GAVGSGHAAIRLVGGTARQNSSIGGRHVRVRPHDRGDAPVEIPSHGHLFPCHFRVKIDEFYFYGAIELAPDLFGFAERAVRGWHVNAALKVQDGTIHAIARAEYTHARAGGIGVIGRAEEPRLAREIVMQFALVPNVIARSEHIETEAKQLLGD